MRSTKLRVAFALSVFIAVFATRPAICSEAAHTRDCIRNVTIRGGGESQTAVDKQIQTQFTITNGGCIVASSTSSITVTSGSNLTADFFVGTGPAPTSGTLDGSAVNVGIPLILNKVTIGHKLTLTNKDAPGGSDTDKMSINVQ